MVTVGSPAAPPADLPIRADPPDPVGPDDSAPGRTPRMTVTPDQSAWFAQTFSAIVANCDKAVLGKEHVDPAGADRHALRGPPAARGRARHRQDQPGHGHREHGAGHAARASSSRPTCCPRDVTGVTIYDQGTRRVRVPPRADLRDHRARRRDQPGLAEDPVGAARGDGGAQVTVDGVRARGRRAVHGDRDAEPDRAGRHLPAARGPARPLPDEDVARLPRPRRDGARPA